MKKTVIVIALSILCLALLSGCGQQQQVFKQQSAADPLDFKQAYEALNAELNDEGQPKYYQLDIPEDNNIVILSYDELMKFIDNGSGLLYLGRSGCPWCRKLLPTMLEFAEQQACNIYYYDVREIREDNGAEYQALLAALDAWLPQDTVTQKEDEPDFDPQLKRVVLPHLFFFSSGQVKADWIGYQDDMIDAVDTEGMMAKLTELYAVM